MKNIFFIFKGSNTLRIYGVFILLTIFACTNLNNMQKETLAIPENFDWQGHRGTRGLKPENTIPAFIKALEYPIKSLELDVCISKDNIVIVSHEPWMKHVFCSHPDGKPVTHAESKNLKIYEMDYATVKSYDCGLRPNPDYPDQVLEAVYKPSLEDMVRAVEAYCEETGREKPDYNIEIKSEKEHYGVFHPLPAPYVETVLKTVNKLGIHKRCNLQSFDIAILQEIRKRDKDISVALLVDNPDGVEANLERLGFIPNNYSPYFRLVFDKKVIDSIHDKGMRLIPWTVNDKVSMRQLITLGVDGIITDYPNYITEL